jgi:hypothetical protein
VAKLAESLHLHGVVFETHCLSVLAPPDLECRAISPADLPSISTESGKFTCGCETTKTQIFLSDLVQKGQISPSRPRTPAKMGISLVWNSPFQEEQTLLMD